ncbi:Uncharacterised protein [Salmonella enterica]|uniref:Uncharacterized protein n=1 Tax=Salmonella enterica TaxID=28901 RepID=A0A7D8ESM2_SALER|nr:Uncharacterised protein [Salmonella enterica]
MCKYIRLQGYVWWTLISVTCHNNLQYGQQPLSALLVLQVFLSDTPITDK